MKNLIICLMTTLLSSGIAFAQLTVWLPDTTAAPGTTIYLPLYTSYIDTGREILTYQMSIVYDTSVAVFDSFEVAGTITPPNWYHTYNLDTAGVVLGGSWYYEPPYLQGEGVLVYLKFVIPENAVGWTDLTFTSFLFHEEIPLTIDGTIIIDAPPITVSGNAFLQNQSVHSGTKALFQADGYGAVTDSSFTDAAGFYELDIHTGIYDVIFSHNGYQTQTLPDQTLTVGASLPEVTLTIGDSSYISGSLSGTLAGVLYIIDGDITVNQGDSLIIEPGATLCFRNGYDFTINGYLWAVGTETDSIVFKEYDPATSQWEGVTFLPPSDDNSRMEYCLILSSAVDGLKLNTCSPTISHCKFVSNQYNGLSIYQSNALIEWCEFYVSESEGVQCFLNSNATFDNCFFHHNRSHGIMIMDNSNVTINGGASYSNEGAGIYGSSAQAHISGVDIYENTGSGIYLMDMISVDIALAYITDNSGIDGGGIYLYNSSPIISNSTIDGNNASSDGGGMYCHYDAEPNLYQCSLSGNSAADRGGGLLITGGDDAVMDYCTFNNNFAEEGGGIYFSGCEAPLTHCTIDSNYAIGDGGGIYFYYGSNSFNYHSVVRGNQAQEDGGGIYCKDGAFPQFNNFTFNGNLAWGNGGGAHFYTGSSGAFYHCTFEENTAGYGGGICSFTQFVTIDHCAFIGNHATNSGGGVRLGDGELTNCTFFGNSAVQSGSGIYISSSNPEIINSIFSSHLNSGCIYFYSSSDASLSYCDFYGNTLGNFSGSMPHYLGQLSTVNANGDSCDIFSNIYLDPLFYSVTGDSAFRLTANSPCIDAGDPASPLDPDGSIADMGVYYFQQPAIWNMRITCTGETGSAPNEFTINIGGDEALSFTPIAPPPPQYMCWTQMWDTTTSPWTGPYSEMIYQWADSGEFMWVLEVDPNGNVIPPISRTAVFTWNPADLPALIPPNYGFWIEDAEGNVVISDMAEQDSLTVTGSANEFYYIKYGPVLLWQLTMTCTGETGTAPNQFAVGIAGGENWVLTPIAPPPPEYMCWIQMWDTTASPWGGPYGQTVCPWVDTSQYLWTIEIDPNGNTLPTQTRTSVITWNPADLPVPAVDYHFYIEDAAGNTVIADMQMEDTLTVIDSVNVFYYMKYGKTTEHFIYNLAANFNLISLPLIPPDNGLNALFPNAVIAYGFENGTYTETYQLENGKAYWLYVPAAEIDTIYGQIFNSYSTTTGLLWEMMGSVSQNAIPELNTGSIVVMYGFAQTYYNVPDLLVEPGRAYWVNFSIAPVTYSLGGNGTMNWGNPGLVAQKTAARSTNSLDDWELDLEFTGSGMVANHFVLTIGGQANAQSLPAPPPPPEYSVWGELYQADWAEGPFFTVLQPPDNAGTAVWQLSLDPNGSLPPINPQTASLQWNPAELPPNGDFHIVDYYTGQMVVEDMRSQNALVIEGVEPGYFNIVQQNAAGINPVQDIPLQYFLAQNTPNPFNPTSTIKYGVKETVKVNLTVYNILGEQAAVLVNDIQPAGYYAVDFNAVNLSSGVYFYRLQAGDFSDIKKMVIVK